MANEKRYPFNLAKHEHDIFFRYNRAKNELDENWKTMNRSEFDKLDKLINTLSEILGMVGGVLSFGCCGGKSVQFGRKFPELFPEYNIRKDGDYYDRFVIIDGVELFQFIYEDELTDHDKELLMEVA